MYSRFKVLGVFLIVAGLDSYNDQGQLTNTATGDLSGDVLLPRCARPPKHPTL